MLLGIDLGGTKIEAILLDDNGTEVLRKRTPTPVNNYQQIISAICQLVEDVDVVAKVTLPVGIGTPGAISPATGLMKNSNTVCMNGKAFLHDITTALKRPVKIENDANCFALSEAIDGAGQGDNCVFGVIIGTGTGAGLVINQTLLSGPNAITGEWGHNPLPWADEDELQGGDCYCGKTGCIETWLSGPGMSKNYSSNNISSKQIVLLAEQGNEHASQYLEHYYHRVAKSLSHVINIIDPDCIVLGGGMSNIEGLYKRVPQIWSNYVFSDSVNTKLKKAKHGDSSGVRGAAWLWKETKMLK